MFRSNERLPRYLLRGWLFVLRGAADLVGVGAAHVGAFLCVSVIACPGEMIDVRAQVHPDDYRASAMGFGVALGRKLIRVRGSAGWGKELTADLEVLKAEMA